MANELFRFMYRSIKLFFILIVFILLAMVWIGCPKNKSEDGQGENTMSSRAITEVLKEHTDKLMSVPGVVGVAQGLCDKKPCIIVYVSEITPELEKAISKNLDGYAVRIEETGVIKARPKKKK